MVTRVHACIRINHAQKYTSPEVKYQSTLNICVGLWRLFTTKTTVGFIHLRQIPSLCVHGSSQINKLYVSLCGPGSSVGIATDYGLDGPGSNHGREEIFRPSRPALGPTQASCKMGTGSFPGVKCGRGVLLTTHLLLVPRSWKSWVIPLPTLWVTPGL
jgi:hypothetical protein